MPQKEDVRALIDRYLTGTLLENDREALKTILNDPAAAPLLNEISDDLLEMRLEGEYEFPAVQDRVKKQVLEHIRRQRPVVRRISWKRVAGRAAAVLIVLAGAATLFWVWRKPVQPFIAPQLADVAPGGNGALLKLANGSVIQLDSLGNGVVAAQQGVKAVLQNGSLHYEETSTPGDLAAYNTVVTPKGRQFRLTLPDGTTVWLNAGSALTFPTTFARNSRVVELSGQAYFEVAANAAAPFKVSTPGDQRVEVLGTSFDINAYPEDEIMKTTLLNGAVRCAAGSRQLVLKPGQQARLENKQLRLVENADTEQAIAWKNGLFNFENVRLQDAMRELERWYDIEVVYQQGIPEIEFVGKISKNLSLQSVLRVLERAGVHFRLEGKQLIVQPV